MKKVRFILLFLTLLIVSAGCVKESDLKKPIQQYISQEYGLNEDFKFLTWDDNWLEGIDHQTAIELKKPYHTTVFISLARDTFEIIDENSDDVYEELFKGAYIKQHPMVMSELNHLVKTFNFLKKSPDEYDKTKGNFFYFLNTNIATDQETKLVKQFKAVHSIDTAKLIPSLKPNPDSGSQFWSLSGVINFDFYFNTKSEDDAVPKAQDVLEEIKKSNVLTEGLYCIEVVTVRSEDGLISIGVDSRNSGVQFRVDANGEIKDIKVLTNDGP